MYTSYTISTYIYNYTTTLIYSYISLLIINSPFVFVMTYEPWMVEEIIDK